MRTAGRLAAEVLAWSSPTSKPGVDHRRLDRICHDHIVDTQAAFPAPLNYRGSGAIPEVDLHLGQPRGLPRHPGRQDPEAAATSSTSM